MPATPPMQSPGQGCANLWAGILDRFSEILGDGASYATFHFASVQEGVRRAAGFGPADLRPALAGLDDHLGHTTKLVREEQSTVGVTVSGAVWLGPSNRVLDGIVLGLMEGVLKGVRRKVYEGRVTARRPEAAEADLVFEVKA